VGQVVLIEKPIVGVLDLQWRDKTLPDVGFADSAALAIELAARFSPSVAKALSHLHPANGVELPADDVEEDEEEEHEYISQLVKDAWAHVADLSNSAKERLHCVLRLNCMGFYTNSEQLCHSQEYAALTVTGLFLLASGFNHSCQPSITRFSIGDVTAFVTNRPVAAGEELCISYIESELLCAPTSMRCQSINRDFVCSCVACTEAPAAAETKSASQRQFLHVDAQVQANFALLDPEERAEQVAAALRGDLGDEDGEDREEVIVLGKDAQELRVIQALACMELKSFAEALLLWRQLAAFSCHHCMPFDEALCVYALFAALCSLEEESQCVSLENYGAASSTSQKHLDASEYVGLALSVHRAAFGLPSPMFSWRYRKEVENGKVSDDARTRFWTVVEATCKKSNNGIADKLVEAWPDFVAAWRFQADEVPPRQDGNATAP